MADDNDLLLLGAAGLLGYYLYTKSQEAALAQQTALVGAPVVPDGMTIAHYAPPPDATSMIAPVAGLLTNIAAKLANIPLVGALAPLAVAGTQVVAQDIVELAQGNLSTGNVLTGTAVGLGAVGAGAVGAGAVGVGVGVVGGVVSFGTVWLVLGVGKLLHIDLFGHDLDNVNHILLNAFNNPITKDNTQFGQPIYFLDGDSTLHQIPGDILNKAGFSWRAIISVDQRVIDFYHIGEPLSNVADAQTPPPPGVTPTSVSYAERPANPSAIRAMFGCSAIFKIGNSNDLYGPGSLLAPGNAEWEQKYGTANCPAPLSGSPAELMATQDAALRAKRRAAGF